MSDELFAKLEACSLKHLDERDALAARVKEAEGLLREASSWLDRGLQRRIDAFLAVK